MTIVKRLVVTLFITFLVLTGCGGGGSGGGVLLAGGDGCDDATPIKVLFIGNSYTYYNSMPSLVEQLGCSLGYKIEDDSTTPGGYRFLNHKDSLTTQTKINARNWDFVVLQNQSQYPGFWPDHVTSGSLPNAQALVDLVHANDPTTEIVYYQTWGRENGDVDNCGYYWMVCTYEGHTQALEEGYGIYQAGTGGLIAPVGTKWLSIFEDDANRPFSATSLWGGDGSHPTLTGSFLAASVILQQIIAAPVSSSDYTGGLGAASAAYILGMVDSP
jgi:hypothetical protein